MQIRLVLMPDNRLFQTYMHEGLVEEPRIHCNYVDNWDDILTSDWDKRQVTLTAKEAKFIVRSYKVIPDKHIQVIYLDAEDLESYKWALKEAKEYT